jgi:molecular chaperone GrpE
MTAFDPRFQTPEGAVGASGDGDEVPSSAERSASDGTSSPPANEPAAETADGQPAADAAAVDVEVLQAKAAKADEYLALAQRTQADFENYRRRTAREAAVATQRGAMKLAKELLPAVDNLERALAHVDERDSSAGDTPQGGAGEQDAFVAGVKVVHADLIAALQRAGIERYSPEGEPFDPTLHEAVAQQPFEGFEPGTVVEVFQRGYRIGESVLRPARVVVAG